MAFDGELPRPVIDPTKAERLLQAADYIERLKPELFDMETFGTCRGFAICGCIAYHVAVIASKGRLTSFSDVPAIAAEYLMLTDPESMLLFRSRNMDRHDAARVLRDFARTGRLDFGYHSDSLDRHILSSGVEAPWGHRRAPPLDARLAMSPRIMAAMAASLEVADRIHHAMVDDRLPELV